MSNQSNTTHNLLYLALAVVVVVIIMAGVFFLVISQLQDDGEIVSDDFQEVATIVIDGDLTHVFASVTAEEQGCGYFYSGNDESQLIVVELLGGAFAASGDAFEMNGYMYGTLGNTDDALIFGDAPGVYRFTAHDFAICISDDLPTVKADRAYPQQPERYVEYPVSPN